MESAASRLASAEAGIEDFQLGQIVSTNKISFADFLFIYLFFIGVHIKTHCGAAKKTGLEGEIITIVSPTRRITGRVRNEISTQYQIDQYADHTGVHWKYSGIPEATRHFDN